MIAVALLRMLFMKDFDFEQEEWWNHLKILYLISVPKQKHVILQRLMR